MTRAFQVSAPLVRAPGGLTPALVPLQTGHQVHPAGRRRDWENLRRVPAEGARTCLFQYTISGEAYFRDETGVRAMRAGTGFLIPLPSPTAYWVEPGSHWEWMWLAFGGRAAEETVRQISRMHGYIIDLPLRSAPMRIAVRLHEQALQDAPRTAWRVSAELYSFLMQAQEYLAGQEPGPSTAVRRARQILEERYHDPGLGLESLAAAVGLSKFHFSRCFKAETGVTPGAYLEELRLRRAMELITLTEEPVKRIAAAVGYNHAAYFIRVFRGRFGCTPGEMRRR